LQETLFIMNGNGNALGLIETLGLVGLVSSVDAMLKAASVELASPVIKLDGGVVSVMVRGDVSSVRAAVEAGASAAARVGELRAAHVIPRPDGSVIRAFAGATAR
jgi:ethanolamine utilization protein EutM